LDRPLSMPAFNTIRSILGKPLPFPHVHRHTTNTERMQARAKTVDREAQINVLEMTTRDLRATFDTEGYFNS